MTARGDAHALPVSNDHQNQPSNAQNPDTNGALMAHWTTTATHVARQPEVSAHMERARDALRAALAAARADPSADVEEPLASWWADYGRFLEAITAALPVSCSAGCSHCCHDNPRGVSGVELRSVLSALRALEDGEERLARMATLSEAMAERMERLGDHDAAWREYKASYEPCPALSDDGRCTIYAARPLACRMFFSVTNPDWCDRRHPNNRDAVNPHLQPSAQIRDLLWELSDALGLGDLPEDLQTGVTALRNRG